MERTDRRESPNGAPPRGLVDAERAQLAGDLGHGQVGSDPEATTQLRRAIGDAVERLGATSW